MLKYHPDPENIEIRAGSGDSTMQRVRSAGLIVFRRDAGTRKFLLLHYATKSGHWDLPKGKIEKGEDAHATARRELKEETGITAIRMIDGFQAEIAYYFTEGGQTFYKEVVFFLAETDAEDVKLSHEHIGHRWLSLDSALKQLTYDTAKGVLQKADAFLNS